MTGATAPLQVEPLSAAAFEPFGDLIAPAAARDAFAVNAGSATRFDDLATIEVGAAGGRPRLGIFRAAPRPLPFTVALLERHPLGSQAFVPLDPRLRYVVVVAASPQQQPRAFLAGGGQGINYRPGVWHHPLIALDGGDFLVLDRGGPGSNCDEVALATRWTIDPR